MSHSSLPAYHYLNGSLGLPPPFEAKGATMYSFGFSADWAKLQTVCDQWFNLPSGGRLHYRPLLPVVLVTFTQYQAVKPTAPPYNSWGKAGYKEVIFSILVVRLKREGPVWLADHVGVLVPYIFVDNMEALACGREMYGMPKSWGWIDLPEAPTAETLDFGLQAVGTKQFSPDRPFQRLPVAAVRQQTGSDGAGPHHLWSDLETAFEAIRNMLFGSGKITLPDLNLVVEVAEIFAEQRLPFCSLRQLRSIASPEAASYQAAIDFSARMEGFHGAGRLPGNFKLELPPNALYPIGPDLGLASGQSAQSAFWLTWDFRFETGREIWPSLTGRSWWRRMKDLFS